MTGRARDVPGQREAALAQLREYRASLARTRDAIEAELRALPLMDELNQITDRIASADAAITELTRDRGTRAPGVRYRQGTLGWAREYVHNAIPGQDLTSADLAVVFLDRGWTQGSTVNVRMAASKALGVLCRDEGLVVHHRHGVYRKASPPPPVS